MKIPVWLKPGLWGAAFGGIAMAIVGFSQLGWKTAASADNLAQERADTAFLSLGWRVLARHHKLQRTEIHGIMTDLVPGIGSCSTRSEVDRIGMFVVVNDGGPLVIRI